MCKWASQAYVSVHWLLQDHSLKSQDVLQQHFKNFLNACLHVLNGQKKQKNISNIVWNQHTKNFCMCPYV